jgi:L-asparaginase II
MPDQLLVEVTRNDVVESRHFGSAVVCDDRGNVLHGWGDIEKLIFPRSALKPLLAIDLVNSGASGHFGLSDAEITIACASHQGEPMHQQLVTAWLDRLELTTWPVALIYLTMSTVPKNSWLQGSKVAGFITIVQANMPDS